MSKKTAGLLVGGALIIVALGVYGASKIHIVKQNTQPSQTQKNVEVSSNKNAEIDNTKTNTSNKTNANNTNTKANKSDNVSTDNNENKKEDSKSTSNKETDNTTENKKEDSKPTTSNKAKGWQEINEDSINYNVREMASGGVVVSKATYLDSNNQLLYRVGIQIGVGSDISELSYYCTYNAYSLLNVDDIVTVKYKQVTDTVYAVTSVSKDK